MEKVCINLRMQDFEKLSNFCKITLYNKKDVILKAIEWQFNNLEDYSLTYLKASRRTTYIYIEEDDKENLSRLAEFMHVTTAQAGLIAVRNFLGAAEEGAHTFFNAVATPDMEPNFIITVPSKVYLAVASKGTSVNMVAKEALLHCKDLKTLEDVDRKARGTQSPTIRIILKDERHRSILAKLMVKFQESKGRVISRCIATYLGCTPEEDLEIF